MPCWMLWHGGASWSPPEIPRDLEPFDSMREAKDAFWRRGDFDPFFPCVGSDAYAYIFLYDPTEVADPYPDRIIRYGPRGGVVLEHA